MFRVADRALVRWHTYLLVAMGLFCMIAIIVVCLFSRRPVGILFRRQKVRFWNSVERWRPRSAGAVVRIRAGHARSQTALDDPNRPRRGGGTRGVARETVWKIPSGVASGLSRLYSVGVRDRCDGSRRTRITYGLPTHHRSFSKTLFRGPRLAS